MARRAPRSRRGQGGWARAQGLRAFLAFQDSLSAKTYAQGGQGRRPTMPVYVRAADSDRWHWCLSCSRYPWKAVTTGALFRSDRPRAELCKQCLRKEREGKCDEPP